MHYEAAREIEEINNGGVNAAVTFRDMDVTAEPTGIVLE
jgi:hypothetical protein